MHGFIKKLVDLWVDLVIVPIAVRIL